MLKQYQLVSVSAARDLALSIHRSAEEVVNSTESRRYKIPTAIHIRFLDPFFGFASIPFPSLSGKHGVPEHGLWCKGCEMTLAEYNNLRLPATIIATKVPSDCDPWRIFFHLISRAYSRSGLLRRSQECHGARSCFMPGQQEGTRTGAGYCFDLDEAINKINSEPTVPHTPSSIHKDAVPYTVRRLDSSTEDITSLL